MAGPVEKAWQSFAQNVISPEAAHVQRQIQRETFYAGAYAMMTLILGKTAHTQKQAVHDEMQAFFREVTAKRKN